MEVDMDILSATDRYLRALIEVSAEGGVYTEVSREAEIGPMWFVMDFESEIWLMNVEMSP